MSDAHTLNMLREAGRQASPDGQPHIDDDAVIYAGSCTFEKWQCHVPMILCERWSHLSEETRLAIYLTAKSFTSYNDPLGSALSELSRDPRIAKQGGE